MAEALDDALNTAVCDCVEELCTALEAGAAAETLDTVACDCLIELCAALEAGKAAGADTCVVDWTAVELDKLEEALVCTYEPVTHTVVVDTVRET